MMFLRNVDFSFRTMSQTVHSLRTYNKAVCALSTYISNRNNNNNNFKRKTPNDLLILALNSIKIQGSQDWNQVKQFILSHELNKGSLVINEQNMGGMLMASIIHLNRLDLAQSYLQYLKDKDLKPNLATIGRYLRLLYENYKDNISKSQEKEISNICHDLRQTNSILDSRTIEAMLLALSLTKDWKKCIDLLQEIKKTSKPNFLAYSALIAAAFVNKEEQLAWSLFHEVFASDRMPSSIAFLSYLKTLKRLRKKESIIKNLEKLFMFLKETETHCPENVVNDIIQTFKLGQKTTVKFSGHCTNCQTKLDKMELTNEEFAELKGVFFKNAIVGKDIFIKTNPEEMRQFQSFVENMGKYDVVLDGLNIAYSMGTQKGYQVFAKNLATVISHFVQQNKSILMLGRVHMTKWPKSEWNYIKQNATIFLTQNISQDDPYLLYCALHSGKNTIIITRDLMRGHKFLLKDRKYKILFDRWLTQRQYSLLTINNLGKVFFRIPPHFSAIAQNNGNTWHIPYIPENDESINEAHHKTWLCLNCN